MSITRPTIRSAQAARSRQLGAQVELLVQAHLIRAGALVQQIATPCVVVAGRKRYTAPVVGDLVGIDAAGRPLLVECKQRSGRKPVPSDFREHQREFLCTWQRRGGVALIAWFEMGTLRMVPANEIIGAEPFVPCRGPDSGP